MVVSEEQAKRKMCPVRPRNAREIDTGGPQTCLASDCMMWKWVMIPQGNHPFTMTQSRDHGYCGLTTRE